MKKMFVFDYDGTYYKNQAELLSNIELMESVRALGHLFVVATGRSYVSFMKEVEKFDIKYDYLILSSGALILDKDHNIIKTYPMDLNMVKGVDKLLEPYNAKLVSQMFIDNFENSEILQTHNQVIKMTYTYERSDMSLDIQQAVNDYTNESFRTYVIRGLNVDYVEIISSNTNKGLAILELQKHLKNVYEVIAAGDSENDVEMLIEFDGFLMKNHDPRLDTFKLRQIESISAIIQSTLNIKTDN